MIDRAIIDLNIRYGSEYSTGSENRTFAEPSGKAATRAPRALANRHRDRTERRGEERANNGIERRGGASSAKIFHRSRR